jgi:hypothetical protein
MFTACLSASPSLLSRPAIPSPLFQVPTQLTTTSPHRPSSSSSPSAGLKYYNKAIAAVAAGSAISPPGPSPLPSWPLGRRHCGIVGPEQRWFLNWALALSSPCPAAGGNEEERPCLLRSCVAPAAAVAGRRRRAEGLVLEDIER